MLQVVMHTWIASLLFMWIGEMYEAQGSRSSMVYVVNGRSSVVSLCLLLANGDGHVQVRYCVDL